MSLAFDLFYSFRSPYSYLATPRILEIARDFDVDVVVRPVYPLAIRDDSFFDRVDPRWPAYLMRDTTRIAEQLAIPYRWPRPDPVYRDPDTGRYPPDRQPHIHRLTRMGVAAARRGAGLAFIGAVSALIWGGTQGWNEGTRLADALTAAGLDAEALEADVRDQGAALESAITANQQALDASGHWGVPTMVFEGEPFFGQDRIELLLWRLRQHGLEQRA
ncbi:MAG TPA: DsbA family protein [Pseudomonadales bacterium]|nr:DsbA family protein [Pseudomonadales bacterium]